MGSSRRGAAVALCTLAVACGPTVFVDDGTDDGGASSTGSGSASATTFSGSMGSTTVAPGDGSDGSTTAVADDTGTTGDPSGPCPDPIRGLTYLWCGAVSHRAKPGTDGAWVYFGTADGGLWRVPASGGQAEALATGLGDVFDIEIVDGQVHWTAFFDGVVGSVPADGGPLRILADDLWKPSSVALGGGFAFVTQYGDDLPVMRYELQSGLATPLYPDHDYGGHAFVLGDALYFATGTNNGNDATPLWRGTFDGAPLQLVMDAQGSFADIVQEDQTLWWARYRVDDSAMLWTVLDEPAVTTTIHALPAHPDSLALTPERAYWADVEMLDEGHYEERLRSVARDGSDPLVHHTDDAVRGVVTTDAGIVFLLSDAVARLD